MPRSASWSRLRHNDSGKFLADGVTRALGPCIVLPDAESSLEAVVKETGVKMLDICHSGTLD